MQQVSETVNRNESSSSARRCSQWDLSPGEVENKTCHVNDQALRGARFNHIYNLGGTFSLSVFCSTMPSRCTTSSELKQESTLGATMTSVAIYLAVWSRWSSGVESVKWSESTYIAWQVIQMVGSSWWMEDDENARENSP